jgi:recombinational DNA repair protein RecR
LDTGWSGPELPPSEVARQTLKEVPIDSLASIQKESIDQKHLKKLDISNTCSEMNRNLKWISVVKSKKDAKQLRKKVLSPVNFAALIGGLSIFCKGPR